MHSELLPDYVGVYSQAGPGHTRNSDRFRILSPKAPLIRKLERGELYAVFDGIGSKKFGGEAAQTMCDALINFFKQPQKYTCSVQGLQKVLQKGNLTIDSWGYYPGTQVHLGGCAGTILWIFEERLVILHAGDTSALLITENKVHQATDMHNARDGSLTRFFGQGAGLSIDIFETDIAEYNYILLLSDGVSSRLDPKLLAEMVRNSPASIAAQSIIQKAVSKGSTDDATALLVDFIEFE